MTNDIIHMKLRNTQLITSWKQSDSYYKLTHYVKGVIFHADNNDDSGC